MVLRADSILVLKNFCSIKFRTFPDQELLDQRMWFLDTHICKLGRVHYTSKLVAWDNSTDMLPDNKLDYFFQSAHKFAPRNNFQGCDNVIKIQMIIDDP